MTDLLTDRFFHFLDEILLGNINAEILYIFQEVSYPLFGFAAIHHSRSGMSRGLLWRGRDGDTLNTIGKITNCQTEGEMQQFSNFHSIKDDSNIISVIVVVKSRKQN